MMSYLLPPRRTLSNNQLALQLLLFRCADQQGFHALRVDLLKRLLTDLREEGCSIVRIGTI